MPLVHPHDDGIRPAGGPDHCFYCQQKVGSPHLESCVTLTKKVTMQLTIEFELDGVYQWTNEQIVEAALANSSILEMAEDYRVLDCQIVGIADPGPNGHLMPFKGQNPPFN